MSTMTLLRTSLLRPLTLCPSLLAAVTSTLIGQAIPDSLPAPTSTAYMAIGALRMYYQLYGSGSPVLLLHGGFNTVEETIPAS